MERFEKFEEEIEKKKYKFGKEKKRVSDSKRL